MSKPYEKTVRSRRGTHISRIFKLVIIDPVVQLFAFKKANAAPIYRVPSNHPTTKVPTRSTHPTAQVPLKREPSAPFEIIDDTPPEERFKRKCNHTIMRGETECWWCGQLEAAELAKLNGEKKA